MSARTKPRDLMGQPRQVSDLSPADSLKMAGIAPNAMSKSAPAPAMPEGANHQHQPHNLAPRMARHNAAQAKGLLHGRVVHDQAD
jgi:hypothetical protein